jgi:type VI secretion system secreted protein VgrG
LSAGQSAIVIKGGDITFTCPGNWTVKGATHDWGSGGGQAAELRPLPDGAVTMRNWIEANHRDAEGQPMAGQKYKVHFADGSVISGVLDTQGHARIDNVPDNAVKIEYEPRTAKPESKADHASTLADAWRGKLS